MPLSKSIPSHLFLNIQSQNSGLVFQFVLAEFLRTYHLVHRLEKFANEMNLLVGAQTAEFSEKACRALLDQLTELAGVATDLAPSLPWGSGGGYLSSFYHYCQVLARKPKGRTKNHSKLFQGIGKSYQASLKCRNALLLAKDSKNNFDLSSSDKKMITRSLNQLFRAFHRMADQLTHCILEYSQDENVVFFLLRYHEDWDNLFDVPVVASILEKMYPRGLMDVESLLSRRYAKRGFEHILPIISQKAAQLAVN